jgi:hypothetical protein
MPCCNAEMNDPQLYQKAQKIEAVPKLQFWNSLI